MRLAVLFLLVLGCKKPSTFERDLQDIKRGGDAGHRALLRIERSLERHGPHAPPGAGPRILTKEETALNEVLLDMLDGPDEMAAAAAARILPYLRAPGFDERLFRCARVKDYPDCNAAVTIVADDTMLRAYLPHTASENTRVAVQATQTLGSVGRKGIPYLTIAIERGSSSACVHAVFQLWLFLAKDEFIDERILADPLLAPESLAAMKRALVHPGWECRERAVLYLAQFDPAKRETLTPMLVDPSPAVRDAARAMLDGIAYDGKPEGYKEPGDP